MENFKNFKNLPESEFDNFVVIPKNVYSQICKCLKDDCIQIDLENESPAVKKWCMHLPPYLMQDYSVYFNEDCLSEIDVFLANNDKATVIGFYLENCDDVSPIILAHLLIHHTDITISCLQNCLYSDYDIVEDYVELISKTKKYLQDNKEYSKEISHKLKKIMEKL